MVIRLWKYNYVKLLTIRTNTITNTRYCFIRLHSYIRRWTLHFQTYAFFHFLVPYSKIYSYLLQFFYFDILGLYNNNFIHPMEYASFLSHIRSSPMRLATTYQRTHFTKKEEFKENRNTTFCIKSLNDSTLCWLRNCSRQCNSLCFLQNLLSSFVLTRLIIFLKQLKPIVTIKNQAILSDSKKNAITFRINCSLQNANALIKFISK